MSWQEPWPNWHCVWLDEIEDGWEVRCIIHGAISQHPTHLEGFEGMVRHDEENGTFGM